MRADPSRIGPFFLFLAFAGMPTPTTAFEFAKLIDSNPAGNDFISGFARTEDRWLFTAFDGSQEKAYSTDGRTTQELNVAENGRLRPEAIATPGPNRTGSRGLEGGGYFVADGPDGRSLYTTDGFRADVLASGVSGRKDEDIYFRPLGWQTKDYLYFSRNAPEAAGLYRTDGATVSRVGLPDAAATSYQFLGEFEGDALLVGEGPEGDFLVRENALGSSRISAPAGLEVLSALPATGQAHFQFTGTFGDGRRMFILQNGSIEMIDFDLGWKGVQSPIRAEDSLFFKSQSDDVSPFERIFHFKGQTVSPLDLGRNDHSGMQIVATEGHEALIQAGGRLVRTDGVTVTPITNEVGPNTGGAWLVAQTDGATLLQMDTSNGMPFSKRRGLYRIVDNEAILVDIGSTAEAGYSIDFTSVTVSDESIYFSAKGGNGVELFRLRGDELTEFDINPAGDSLPAGLQLIHNRLFFTATGTSGREAYLLDGDDLSLIDLNPLGDSDPWFTTELNGAILVRALVESGTGSRERELVAIYLVPEPSTLVGVLLLVAGYAACCSRSGRHRTSGSASDWRPIKGPLELQQQSISRLIPSNARL